MFIAIVKLMTFRIFSMIVIFFDLDINRIDVKTVFLYGFINQLVYVKISKKTKLAKNQNMIYKLLKALYSLK